MHLGKMRQVKGKHLMPTLVNVQEKKVSEHQKGKQVVHSSFIAKK
jgi:hypothetical protein